MLTILNFTYPVGQHLHRYTHTHTHTHCFFNINFNIIFPATTSSTKCSFPIRFSNWNCICISNIFPSALSVPCCLSFISYESISNRPGFATAAADTALLYRPKAHVTGFNVARLHSRFRREVDENCALLGYYAACSGKTLTDVSGQPISKIWPLRAA